MRASGIDTTMMDLGRLLENLHEGYIALPDFQRDFDWSDSDVKELLVTVFSGWPAGSLLLMSGRQSLFRLRGFEDADCDPDKVNLIVLDGQQRLTSLYHALYDRGPNVYAIDYRRIGPSGELEDAIRSIPRHEWDKSYREIGLQIREGLIPCSQLVSPTNFFEWRDAAVAAVTTDQQESLKSSLTDTYREVLFTIHQYEIPAVILEESLEPAAIARIFERVNRLGMRLGTFDLMVAKVYEPDWNLRAHWDTVRRDKPIIDVFLEEDGMPVLQTISLLFDKDIRQSAVLRLPKRTVHENWEKAAVGVEAALRFLEESCGVTNSDYLPYKSMAVLFAAIAVDYPVSQHRDLLQRLFWSKSFAQAYDVAANTRIVADYQALLQFFGRQFEGEELDISEIDPVDLLYAARRSDKAIWAAFICALTVADPPGLFVDLFEGVEQSGKMAPRIVSLLPRDLKPDMPDSAPPHLRVLSMVRTSQPLARLLSRKRLPLLVRDLLEDHDQQSVDQALKKHFLPSSHEILETVDDWQGLLHLRRESLIEFLQRRFDIPIKSAEETPI